MPQIKEETLKRYIEGNFKSHKELKSYLKYKLPNKEFCIVGTSAGNVTTIIIKDGKLQEKMIKFYWTMTNVTKYTELYNFILTSD